MEKSESINELAAALAKAQGSSDRFDESALIHKIIKKFRGKNKTIIDRKSSFFNKIAFGSTDCWYFVGALNHLGYGTFRKTRAHRESWSLFNNKKIPKNMCVLHKCDVRNCVNPDHLFLGTQQENVADCLKKGRNRNKPKHGEDNHFSKLTEGQISKIRKIRNRTGLSYKKISKDFDVSTMTIYRACKYISWSKLK
jgi:hypothetical protein